MNLNQTDETGLKLLKEKGTELIRLYREKEAAADVAKEASAAFETYRQQMAAMLQAAGIDSLEHDGHRLYIRTRTSVRVPKTAEDRKAFFDYLKSRNVYEQMITVNSQTLNAFYQGEYEVAQDTGNQDFKIPGIDDHTERYTLEIKGAK